MVWWFHSRNIKITSIQKHSFIFCNVCADPGRCVQHGRCGCFFERLWAVVIFKVIKWYAECTSRVLPLVDVWMRSAQRWPRPLLRPFLSFPPPQLFGVIISWLYMTRVQDAISEYGHYMDLLNSNENERVAKKQGHVAEWFRCMPEIWRSGGWTPAATRLI